MILLTFGPTGLNCGGSKLPDSYALLSDWLTAYYLTVRDL
jgi:hypothetical protein